MERLQVDLTHLLCILLLSGITGVSAQDLCDLSINQCSNGLCLRQANGFLGCTCNRGFIQDPVDPLSCHPIPPCNLMPGTADQQCANGYCQLQANRLFGCTCYSGFHMSVSNYNICEDIDECLLPTTGCAIGACQNLPGTYYCSACEAGFKLEQITGKCQKTYYPTPQRPNNNFPWFFMMDWFW